MSQHSCVSHVLIAYRSLTLVDLHRCLLVSHFDFYENLYPGYRTELKCMYIVQIKYCLVAYVDLNSALFAKIRAESVNSHVFFN